MRDDVVLNRIRGEFLEMPGLRLTSRSEQAQRLYGLEQAQCQHALDRLVEARFLCVKSNGTYGRLSEGVESARRRLAKDERSLREYRETVSAWKPTPERRRLHQLAHNAT
jgi:hypothetical protein